MCPSLCYPYENCVLSPATDQSLAQRVSVSPHWLHASMNRYAVWRGAKFGVQNAVLTINYMFFMNKFSSIMIIDSRKNSRKYRVYHVMFWAIHIAKQVCIFSAKSIFQWFFAELTDNRGLSDSLTFKTHSIPYIIYMYFTPLWVEPVFSMRTHFESCDTSRFYQDRRLA